MVSLCIVAELQNKWYSHQNKYIYAFMQCAPYFCPIETQSGDSQQIFRTVSSVKYYENKSGGSALIRADRRTESRDEANRRFSTLIRRSL